MATKPATSIPTKQRRTGLFYPSMAVLSAAVVFAGFARTYYLKDVFHTPALPFLLHVHGLVMTCWIVLLFAQSALVAAHRTDIHRRLGAVGGYLAAAIAVIGVAVAINAAKLGHAPPPAPPLVFLAVPLGDILVFGSLVSAALYYRRRPELHKRLMLVATIAILPAAIARWPMAFVPHLPFFFFAIADLMLIACVLFDYAKTRRLNPAFAWGGLLLIASHPLRLLLARTDAWMSFAHWITRT